MKRRVPREVLDQLRHVPLFASCTNRQLQRVAGLGTQIFIDEGRTVTVSGAPGSECFIVLSGRASCRVHGLLVATFGPGDFFGELSLIDGGSRSASVVAETPMQVLNLNRGEFGELLEAAPPVTRTMLGVLAARLRAADALIAQPA